MSRLAKFIFASAFVGCSPAPAAPIAEVMDASGARIVLDDAAGPCVGSARLAVYYSGPVKVPGCWVADGQSVTIAFLDGDMARVPLAAFKPVSNP